MKMLTIGLALTLLGVSAKIAFAERHTPFPDFRSYTEGLNHLVYQQRRIAAAEESQARATWVQAYWLKRATLECKE